MDVFLWRSRKKSWFLSLLSPPSSSLSCQLIGSMPLVSWIVSSIHQEPSSFLFGAAKKYAIFSLHSGFLCLLHSNSCCQFVLSTIRNQSLILQCCRLLCLDYLRNLSCRFDFTQDQCRVMLSAGLSRRRRLRVCIVLLLPTLISGMYSVWPPGPVSPESLPLNQPQVNSHRYYGIRDHSMKNKNNVLCHGNKKIQKSFTLFWGVHTFEQIIPSLPKHG